MPNLVYFQLIYYIDVLMQLSHSNVVFIFNMVFSVFTIFILHLKICDFNFRPSNYEVVG